MDKNKRGILKHHLNQHHISSSSPIPKSSQNEILSAHRYPNDTNIERVKIKSLFVLLSYPGNSYLHNNKVIPIIAYTLSPMSKHSIIHIV